MSGTHGQFRSHISQRNVKTALAATLCALLYFPFRRDPAFACIGAIFGPGNSMDDSRLNGGDRFFGTVISGVVLCIILFNAPVDTYIRYSLDRMANTGIGVAVILLVNTLVTRERVERWKKTLCRR